MVKIGRTTRCHFHFNASPGTFIKARDLRKRMTCAEKKVWGELRNRKLLGYKIRRQHPVGQFIVDFFCSERYLVIEIDGEIHDDKMTRERDENRTAELERLGLRVIRFTNEEVMDDMEGVIRKIRTKLEVVE